MEIVRLPKLGLSEFGELVDWKVDVGEHVQTGKILAEIESDKATVEIEARESGVLLETYVKSGEEFEIEVGRPIAVIGAEDEEPPALDEISEATASAGAAATATEASESDQTPEPAESGSSASSDGANQKITPRARKQAMEADLDLDRLQGTGPDGAITVKDVETALESREDTEPTEPSETPGELTVNRVEELSTTRQQIARRLSNSAREKPHVMGTREISIAHLQQLHEKLMTDTERECSLNDLILYAVGRTLQERPEFNAHFEDGEHRYLDEINLGYAVDSPKGLIVPVLRNVTKMSPFELADKRKRLVKQVLNDQHSIEDLQGGTFTVTNVGVFQMDVSFSIINPPEVAILALGQRKPALVERDGETVTEPVITFSLTIDHRPLDGADSGRFLEELARYIEYPGWIHEQIEVV